MHRFTVDEFNCVALNVGFFLIAPDVMMAPATPDERTATLEAYGLSPDGIPMQMNPLLVDTGDQRVIIDPGKGFGEGNELLRELAAANIDPASITGLIITHGHADHFNGCVDAAGRPTFPNAAVYVQRGEWDHWFAESNPEPHHAESFQQLLGPISDQVTFLSGEGEIIPGITAIHTPGHSPHHMAILVNDQLVCVADVLLNPLLVEHPDWYATFDCWPEEVVTTRRAFLARCVKKDWLVSTYHFSPPGLGRVVPDGETWRWEPIG